MYEGKSKNKFPSTVVRVVKKVKKLNEALKLDVSFILHIIRKYIDTFVVELSEH